MLQMIISRKGKLIMSSHRHNFHPTEFATFLMCMAQTMSAGSIRNMDNDDAITMPYYGIFSAHITVSDKSFVNQQGIIIIHVLHAPSNFCQRYNWSVPVIFLTL